MTVCIPGAATTPPVLTPVQLTLIPSAIHSLSDLVTALRYCDRICNLLQYQADIVSNTNYLIISCVSDLFIRLIPVPKYVYPNSPKPEGLAIWGEEMKYETQLEILRLLHLVCRHFLSAMCAVKLTRSFDAIR